MTDKIAAGSRVIVMLTGTCTYDAGGDTVPLTYGASRYDRQRISVRRADIEEVLPPIQMPGAVVFHKTDKLFYEVVLYDATSGSYVLRYQGGTGLVTRPDDIDIVPEAAVDPDPEVAPLPLSEVLEAPSEVSEPPEILSSVITTAAGDPIDEEPF